MAETIPFAAWEPDKSDRANPASEAKGVLSVAGQYGPFRNIVDYNGASAATVAACLGAAVFYDSTNLPHIYLGDAAKLYHVESRIATDRSVGGGYTLVSEEDWDFAQFGDLVVAVSGSEAPQVHDMTPGNTAFANLAGSPPSNATSVARVNDFLMMGKNFTLHWSAFNTPTDWVPAVATQAGTQLLDQEKGLIKKIIGLDYAAIFQERGIRRANYVGPPIVWDFGQDYVEKERGCISRHAAAAWGRVIYYVSDDGFYSFDGQASTPIGYGKVDEYFARRLNYSYRHKVRTVCVGKYFLVGFPAGSSTNISEIMAYSINDQRWTHDLMDLEVLFASPAEPFTVDNFHLLFTSDNLDDTAITPDDIDSAAFADLRRLLAGVQTNHRLGFFSGTNRQAILETGEFEGKPGQRAKVTEIWPMGDFQQGAVSASVGYRRALPGEAIAYTNPTGMNRVGFCPQNIDARFLRGRLLIGAGATWRRAEGISHTSVLTGQR